MGFYSGAPSVHGGIGAIGEWSPEQLAEMQKYYDAHAEGDENRRPPSTPYVPPPPPVVETGLPTGVKVAGAAALLAILVAAGAAFLSRRR